MGVVFGERVARSRGRAGRLRALFVAVGAHLSKRVDIPNGDAGRILDAVGLLRNVSRGSNRHVRQGRGLRRRRHRHGRRPGSPPARRRRLDHRLRGPAKTMQAHEEEAADAEPRVSRINWLRTIAWMGTADLTVEVQELDDNGRPHGTGQFETLEADTVILALGQESDTDFLRPGDRGRVRGRRRAGGSDDPDDRGTGRFAGGDVLPSERTVTVGGTARRRRAVSTPTCAARRSPPARSTRLRRSRACTCDTSGTTTGASGPSSRRRPGLPTSRRCWRGCRPRGQFRSGALPLVRNCFECDGCFGACPEDAVIRLGKGNRYRFDCEPAPAARRVTGSAPCTPSRSCRRASSPPWVPSSGRAGASSRGSAAIPVPEV